MQDRSCGSLIETLTSRWAQWTAIVELFARRRPARRRVDPLVYQALHHELVLTYRSLAEAAEEPKRSVYRELEGLVSPWLSTRTLAQADADILDSLLQRCHQVERDLGGRRMPAALVLAAKTALLAVGIGGSFALLWAWGVEPEPVVGWLRDRTDTAWRTVARSSEIQRLAVVASVVVLISIRVLSRTARD